MSTEFVNRDGGEPIGDVISDAACRICHLTQADDPTRILYHPCKCRGSIRLIHSDCCLTWLAVKKQAECEICTWPIQVEAKWTSSASASPKWTDGVIVGAQSLYRMISERIYQSNSMRYNIMIIMLYMTSDTTPSIMSFINFLFNDMSFTDIPRLLLISLRTVGVTLACSWLLSFVMVYMLYQFCAMHHRLMHLFFFRIAFKVSQSGFTQSFKQTMNRILVESPEFIHFILGAEDFGALIELTNLLHVIVVMGCIVIPHLFMSTVFLLLQYLTPDQTIFRYVVDFLHPRSLSLTLLQSLIALYNGGLTAWLPADYNDELSHSLSFSNMFPSSLIVISRDQLLALSQYLHLSWLVSTVQSVCLVVFVLHMVPRSILWTNSRVFFVRSSVLAGAKLIVFTFIEFVAVPLAIGLGVYVLIGLILFDQPLKHMVVQFAVHPYSSLILYQFIGRCTISVQTVLIHFSVFDVASKGIVNRVFLDPARDPAVQCLRVPFSKFTYHWCRPVSLYLLLAFAFIYLPFFVIAGVDGFINALTGFSLLKGQGLVLEMPHELHVLLTCVAVLIRLIADSEWSFQRFWHDNEKKWIKEMCTLLTTKFRLDRWWLKDDTERERERLHQLAVRHRELQLLRELEGDEAADELEAALDEGDLMYVDPGELASLVDDQVDGEEWPYKAPRTPWSTEPVEDEEIEIVEQIQPDLIESRMHLKRTRREAFQCILRERATRLVIKHFPLRLVTFLFVYATTLGMWLMARFGGPLVLGRVVMRILPFVSLRNNDVICFVAGSLLAAQVGDMISAIPRLVRCTDRVMWFNVFKAVMLIFYFCVCFPFAIGLLVVHFFVFPVHVAWYQQPVFYLEHIFILGLVVVLLPAASIVIKRRIELPDEEDEDQDVHADAVGGVWTGWIASLTRISEVGLRRSRIILLIYETILPSANALILTVALPYFFCRFMLPLRTLLPLFLRIDEMLLIRLLRDSPHNANDDLVISTAIEEAMYRYAFITLASYRITLKLLDIITAWYEKSVTQAWRSRYSHQILVNVPDSPSPVQVHNPIDEVSSDSGSDSSDDEDSDDDIVFVHLKRGTVVQEPAVKLEHIDD